MFLNRVIVLPAGPERFLLFVHNDAPLCASAAPTVAVPPLPGYMAAQLAAGQPPPYEDVCNEPSSSNVKKHL